MHIAGMILAEYVGKKIFEKIMESRKKRENTEKAGNENVKKNGGGLFKKTKEAISNFMQKNVEVIGKIANALNKTREDKGQVKDAQDTLGKTAKNTKKLSRT